MEAKDCILISPENIETKCKFYELEEKCEEIIQAKIKLDVKLREEFKVFKTKYTYFKPYFDFVLVKLGYKIKNPYELEDAYIYEKDGYIQLFYLNNELELFPPSDDEHIGLYKLTEKNLNLSMVDENLMAIKPKGYGHNFTSRLILNQLFIHDKNLYQKFLQECKISNRNFNFFDFTDFLIYHKPFLRIEKNVKNEKNKQFAVFKNCDCYYEIQGYIDNLSEKQNKFIEQLVIQNVIDNQNLHFPEKENRRTI